MLAPLETLEFYREIFARSPVGMTICDATGRGILANDAICQIIGATPEQILAQNIHDIESWKASGLIEVADEAIATGEFTSKRVSLTSTFGRELTANVQFRPFSVEGKRYLLVTFDDQTAIKKAEDEREQMIVDLRQAADEIEHLRAILPLCSFCKKVRDDQGYWEQVDVYIHKHLFADISHSICPDCEKKHYPDL